MKKIRILLIVILILVLPTSVSAAKDTISNTIKMFLNGTRQQITVVNIDGKIYIPLESLSSLEDVDVKLTGNNIHIKAKKSIPITLIPTLTLTPTIIPSPTNIPSVAETTYRNYILPGDSKDFVLKVLGNPVSINKYFNRYYFKTGSFNYVEFDKNDILVKWSNLDNFIIIPSNKIPFKIGSTKLEVINAMGAPTSITEIAFTFRDARVNFDKNGKVVSYVNGKNNKVNIKGL